MSLETQSAVMRAGNNEAALKALALSGNMDAIAALKKLLDAKSSRDAAARQAGLQQPETPPVLEQVVGQLGQQEYAAGGRVRAFAGGGDTAASMLLAEPDPNSRDLGDLFRKIMFGGKTREQYYKEDPAQAPAPAVAPMAAPNPTTRMQRNGSTVPAPAPAPAAPRANVGIAPNMSSGPPNKATTADIEEGKALSRVPMPEAAPEAKDLTDAELTKQLEALTPLQKEREALRTKSREQLEAAYNAKVKNLTPSTYDRFMDFMAGVSAKGGRSAAQALGAGALNMHAKDKGRKTEMASVKEMYDKSDLLLQEAALADKFGDVEKADKLRKEAAQLQKQLAAQKSTEKLQGSQADYYDAQADFVRNDKARIAEMTAQAAKDRANRPTGSGLKAAAGVKPMTPAQRVAAEHRAYVELKKDINNMDVPESTLRAKAKAAVDEATRAPAAASPAAPVAKFIGFK